MAEAYGIKMEQIMQTTTVGLIIALAKEVGIEAALTEANEPLTSTEIANRKSLKERYVREILGCLTASEAVMLSSNDAGESTYFLTEEQKKGKSMGESSPLTPMVAAFAEIFGQLRDCIYASGPYGFSYEEKSQGAIGDFALHSMDNRVSAIFASVPTLEKDLEEGIDVIEFGSGMGSIIASIATRFPKSRFTASELTPEQTETLKSAWSHLPNLKYEVIDMCKLENNTPSQQYDWAMSYNVVHDLPCTQSALNGVRKLLKHPGGLLTFSETCPTEHGTHQEGVGDLFIASIYARSTYMCVRQGFLNENSVALGACSGRTVLQEMARKAGFDCTYSKLSRDYTTFINKTV